MAFLIYPKANGFADAASYLHLFLFAANFVHLQRVLSNKRQMADGRM
jgi:hypothetical protein